MYMYACITIYMYVGTNTVMNNNNNIWSDTVTNKLQDEARVELINRPITIL